jgi:hypothetical protein
MRSQPTEAELLVTFAIAGRGWPHPASQVVLHGFSLVPSPCQRTPAVARRGEAD